MSKIRWRNFKGQAERIDKSDAPESTAREAWNIDTNKVKGAISKAPGFVVENFTNLFPSGLNIKNIAHAVYLKVWSGSTKVNELWEYVVVEFVGDHGLDWHEFHRKVGTTDWTEDPDWSGTPGNPYIHYTGFNNSGVAEGSDSFATDWGGAKAGRCRWVEHNGVLRAACGAFMEGTSTPPLDIDNTSTSYPIQIRYINRLPINDTDPDENMGWFKVYDHGHTTLSYGNCAFGVAKLWRGRSIPSGFTHAKTGNYIFNIESQANTDSGIFWNHSQRGYAETCSIKYVLVPVYDGHQIAPLEVDPLSIYEYVTEATPGKTWAVKLKMYLDYGAYGQPPYRLTGWNIYRSLARMGINEAGQPQDLQAVGYTNYELIANIDSQDGFENIFSTRANINGSGTSWTATINIGWSDNYDHTYVTDIYTGMYIRFVDDDGNTKEYKITSTTVSEAPATNTLTMNFTTEANPSITALGIYDITLNSRWDVDSTNETATLYFLDEDIPLGEAPPWIVQGIDVDNLPKVECNYGGHTFFKDMHFVWDIIYDGERYQNMVRYSYPANHPYAGHDILYRYVIPQGMDQDDEIRGVFNFLDYALIFTKRKIFRYLMGSDGQLEAVGELLWGVGCESIDSMQEHNGVLYWLGLNGKEKTWYYWNPNGGKPEPLGELNQDTMDDICENPDADSELAQGFIIPNESKWVLSVPRFTEEG